MVRYHKGKLKQDNEFPFVDKQLVVIVRVADKISKIYKLQKYFDELQEVCETTDGIEKLKKKYEDITDDLDKAMKEISKFMKEGN